MEGTVNLLLLIMGPTYTGAFKDNRKHGQVENSGGTSWE